MRAPEGPGTGPGGGKPPPSSWADPTATWTRGNQIPDWHSGGRGAHCTHLWSGRMSGLTVDFSFVKPRDTWFLVIQSAEWRGASRPPPLASTQHAPDTPQRELHLHLQGSSWPWLAPADMVGGAASQGVPWSKPRGQHRGGGSLLDAALGPHAHVTSRTPAYL